MPVGVDEAEQAKLHHDARRQDRRVRRGDDFPEQRLARKGWIHFALGHDAAFAMQGDADYPGTNEAQHHELERTQRRGSGRGRDPNQANKSCSADYQRDELIRILEVAEQEQVGAHREGPASNKEEQERPQDP